MSLGVGGTISLLYILMVPSVWGAIKMRYTWPLHTLLWVERTRVFCAEPFRRGAVVSAPFPLSSPLQPALGEHMFLIALVLILTDKLVSSWVQCSKAHLSTDINHTLQEGEVTRHGTQQVGPALSSSDPSSVRCGPHS